MKSSCDGPSDGVTPRVAPLAGHRGRGRCSRRNASAQPSIRRGASHLSKEVLLSCRTSAAPPAPVLAPQEATLTVVTAFKFDPGSDAVL